MIKKLIRNFLMGIRLRKVYNLASYYKFKFGLYRRVLECKRNYAKVLNRIRNREIGQKVKVLFLNNEISKWKCQTVYEAMLDSKIFEPVVGITALGERSLLSDEALEAHLISNERYFDKLGVSHIRVISLFPRRYHDLKDYNPDIVFFPEPGFKIWPQTTEYISNFALTCYVPYYIALLVQSSKYCLEEMHRFLYLYFAQSKVLTKAYSKILGIFNHSYKFYISGHPSLDRYVIDKNVCPCASKRMVIYAPHWTVHGGGTGIRFSTFLETGEFILEYARLHPEVIWVFKPHPNLRKRLTDVSDWSEEKIDSYYTAWNNIGISYFGSEYQDIFLNSECLITDSASFLMEYAATGHPIVHLLSSEWTYDNFPYTRNLLETYYSVRTIEELQKALELVVERRSDPNKSIRINAVKEQGLVAENAGVRITNYLAKLVQG